MNIRKQQYYKKKKSVWKKSNKNNREIKNKNFKDINMNNKT